MRRVEPASQVQPSLAGRLHVFDSFKGLSEFKAQDRSDTFNTTAKREAERVHYASNFQKMCQLVEPFGFVGVHKGWIPEVFEGIDVGQLSFAMIDVDLYEPTLASLQFVYPNLVPGGAIFFDDYGYRNFPGAKIAVDEFLAGLKTPPMLFIENPMGSAYLVK